MRSNDKLILFWGCKLCIQSAKLVERNKKRARIAQVVEQRTENPRVGSSSLPPGILNLYFHKPYSYCRISSSTRKNVK